MRRTRKRAAQIPDAGIDSAAADSAEEETRARYSAGRVKQSLLHRPAAQQRGCSGSRSGWSASNLRCAQRYPMWRPRSLYLLRLSNFDRALQYSLSYLHKVIDWTSTTQNDFSNDF